MLVSSSSQVYFSTATAIHPDCEVYQIARRWIGSSTAQAVHSSPTESPPPPEPTPTHEGRSQVIAEYFQSMEKFLDSQQAVFKAYLTKSPAGNPQHESDRSFQQPQSYRNIAIGQTAENKHAITENDIKKNKR